MASGCRTRAFGPTPRASDRIPSPHRVARDRATAMAVGMASLDGESAPLMHPANDAGGGVDGATSDAPRARAHRRTSASPVARATLASALAALTAVILVAVAAARAPVSRIPSSRLGADAPTPGREGGGPPAGLRFIHIPKTGGTTIESVASDNGVDLGACVKQQRTDGDESMYYPTVGNVQCSVHHVPPADFVPGSFCVKRNPYTRAVSQFLHVVDHPDMPKPERDAADAQYKRHSCASLARYINLRLNRVENNRLVPCLMRDAETDFALRGAAKGTAEAKKNDADAREKPERKTNARADANETPERKTEAETVSAVREARLPAKKAEAAVSERKPVTTTTSHRRPRPAARLGGNATATSSRSSSAASCDAPSRASWSWMDHWEGPHLTAHGGDDCHTLPQFLYTSRCEHVLAFERFDEEVMPFLTRRLRAVNGGGVVDRSGSELRGRAGEATANAGAKAAARNVTARNGFRRDGHVVSSGSGEDAVAAGYRLNQCFNPAVNDSEEMRAARAAMRRVYARDFESLGYDPEQLNLVESHHEWRKTKAQCRGGADARGRATHKAAGRSSRNVAARA